jgi:hypothetical protein
MREAKFSSIAAVSDGLVVCLDPVRRRSRMLSEIDDVGLIQ